MAENPVPEAAPADPEVPVEEGKKKKKRKPKKRKGKGGAVKVGEQSRAQDNSHIVLLKNWEEKPGYYQTNPPTVPIDDQFPPGRKLNPGLTMEYVGDHGYRTTSAELRERERILEYDYEELRRAAEVHR